VQATLVLASVESARKELESVAASLARTPRLEQLLRYLARRYFEGEADQLTEYNIATEVFGRKKTNFIASEDAIARVETHRLRKRLTAFYENEGKDHTVQIAIPLGTYVPVFAERSVETGPAIKPAGALEVLEPDETASQLLPNRELHPETKGAAPATPLPNQSIASSFEPNRRLWLYALVAAAFVLALFAGRALLRSRSTATADSIAQNAKRSPAPAQPPQPQASSPSASPRLAPVSLPFRMIAGYTGAPQRDNAGDSWQPDQYFHEGWALRQSKAFLARTSNPLIFRHGRAGDFSYDIPLAPGVYELHLYFLQVSEAAQSEDAENQAAFSVAINGDLALKRFDIVSDAMGRNVADERVFHDVSPAADGMLHVSLSTEFGTPSLSALQILPGTAHKQLPIRIVMQPTSYTDSNGRLWSPDNYFLSGRYLPHNVPGSNPDLFSSERFGHFEYAFPVDPRDRYTVVLHFVELYFGTEGSGVPGEGSRVFRVLCNGNTLLDNFDIYKEAGNFHVLQKTFHHLKPTAQGKLNVMFEPILNYATVSAIEILDESNEQVP
jgi:hypothetical protein